MTTKILSTLLSSTLLAQGVAGTLTGGDPDFKNCTFAPDETGTDWVNVKLAAEARVKTVLLVNDA